MTISRKLKDYLEKNQVPYEASAHEMLYTAQEIAAALHAPGKELAKVVMVKADGKEVWVDQVLAEDPFIVFQAGSHLETLKIKYSDYARLAQPKVGNFSVHL